MSNVIPFPLDRVRRRGKQPKRAARTERVVYTKKRKIILVEKDND